MVGQIYMSLGFKRLRPFALPLFFAVMPLANLHQLLIFALSFPVYGCLSWFISNYVSHLFISGISFLIHAFFMYAHFFSGTQLGRKTRAGCTNIKTSLQVSQCR